MTYYCGTRGERFISTQPFCIVGKYVEIENMLKSTIGILAIARGTAVVYTCMRAPVNQAY